MLYQNHPNPFNPSTQIQYALHKNSNVSLVIYDMLGKQVMQLIQQNQAAGFYQVTWNGRDADGNQVSSVVYFYRIQTNGFQQVRKMLLVR